MHPNHLPRAIGTTKVVEPSPSASPQEPLSAVGVALLARLSGQVVLAQTAEEFPHIINKLAPYLHRPSLMTKTIDALLLPDDLKKRQGFPFGVVQELANLKGLYDRLSQEDRFTDRWKGRR